VSGQRHLPGGWGHQEIRLASGERVNRAADTGAYLSGCRYGAWHALISSYLGAHLFGARRSDIEFFARDLEARGRARATIRLAGRQDHPVPGRRMCYTRVIPVLRRQGILRYISRQHIHSVFLRRRKQARAS
jgi:hypothetical protein